MASVTYDAEHDILYVDWHEPVATYHKDLGDGRFVRVTPAGEVVGVTIPDFVERLRVELTAIDRKGRPWNRRGRR